MIRLLLILILTSTFIKSKAQDSTNTKIKPLIVTSAVVYTGSLIALDQLWYADFERESFHFFNDNNEWKQVDKIGHFYSSFHISHGYYNLLQWANVNEDKAIFWGSIASILAMTPIEVFDGFSAEYGASTGDLVANTSGTILFFSQMKMWKEIRIHPKYSFHRSDFAEMRPEVLGKNLNEELLKDYNAQAYWLSFDLSKFNIKLPKWLNVAVGYGAENMIYANDQQNMEVGLTPKRKFMIGIDFDLNEYKSRSNFVNTLIHFINLIKIPAPALEIKDGNFRFHSFYY